MMGEALKRHKEIHKVHEDVIRNEYCQDDIMDIMRPTCNVMRMLGIWPSISGERTSWQRVYQFLLIVITYIFILCNLIPALGYWLIQADTVTRVQMCPFIMFESMSIIQYTIFVFRNDRIRRCLRHIQEDWRKIDSADIHGIMLRFVRISKRLAMICAAMMYSGALFFRTVRVLSEEDVVTSQNITIRPVACPSYISFVDLQATPVYETFVTIQCLDGFVAASIAIGACGLTANFVAHASGQLRILRDLMTKLVEHQWQKECEIDEKFCEVVEHQIRVRNFLHLIHHALQQIFLTTIMMNTITLFMLLYFMLIEWKNGNMASVSAYIVCIGDITVHIFIFCYTGELLTVQAEKVATVSCELEWYRLPDRKARYVVLLMIMSNAPTKVSAGSLFDLSLRTFGNAMKTTGAYFNMLRNVI